MTDFKLIVNDKEYNLLFTMLFWKHLSKETNASLNTIEAMMGSPDLVTQMELIASVIYAGVLTYDKKHNTNQGLDADETFDLLADISQEVISEMFMFLANTKVFGRKLNEIAKEEAEELGK